MAQARSNDSTPDPVATPGQGQLGAFTRFASKDPFADQTPKLPAASGGAAGKPAAPPVPGGAGTTTTPGGSTSGAPAAPVAPPSSAVIAVNGRLESVAADGLFPAAQPVFHLKSVTAHSAKIEIAGGTYASGAGSMTLKEKKPITLMNTADGTRYTIELFPQGTPIPAAPVSGSAPAATPPASTTPASLRTCSWSGSHRRSG